MTDEPTPLTEEELQRLETQAGVTGLSSVDARRLIADVRRLHAILRNLHPRAVAAAAAKAGIKLRHPHVPE